MFALPCASRLERGNGPMTIYRDWNIGPCLQVLTVERAARIREIRQRSAQLACSFERNGMQANTLVTSLSEFRAIDHRYDELWSALQVLRVASPYEAQLRRAQAAIDALRSTVYTDTAPFVRALLSVPRATLAQRAPAHVRWVDRLRAAQAYCSDAAASLQQLGRQYLKALSADGVDGAIGASLLRSRIDMDQMTADRVPYSLMQRIGTWGITFEVLCECLCDNAERRNAEANAYFERLLSNRSRESQPLPLLRGAERADINTVELSVDQALNLIATGIEQLDREYGRIVRQLVRSERVRLIDARAGGTMSACIHSTFGPFVQVAYDRSVIGLMRMGHEFGHAIHHIVDHDDDSGTLLASDVDKETWAIFFEMALSSMLMTDAHCSTALRRGLCNYREWRRIELLSRHSMLHRFELELYRHEQFDAPAIDRLWLVHNRAFYGPRIHIPESFFGSWTAVHHLFTAPFYLAAYPLAYMAGRDRALKYGLG
jgi:hypothetical protein